jgi:hypothetical protein
MRRLVSALVAVLLLITVASQAPRPLRADAAQGLNWGVLGLEVFSVAYAVLRFTALKGNYGMGEGFLPLAPIALGVGLGLAGGYGGWPSRIPRGIHGAMWTGGDLFLLGSMLHGAMKPSGEAFQVGFLSWGMAAIGAAAGAYVGVKQVDDGGRMGFWYAGGPAGAMGGIPIAGLIGLTAGQRWSQRKLGEMMGWTFFGTTTTGLAVSYGAAFLFPAKPASGPAAGTAALRLDGQPAFDPRRR